MTELRTWIDANLFKSGGGSGGGAVNSVTGSLVGGTVEGLTDFLKVGKIFVTVRGS